MKWRTKLTLLCFLLSAVCLFSIGMAWKQYAEQDRDRHAFEDLAALVTTPEESTQPNATQGIPMPSLPLLPHPIKPDLPAVETEPPKRNLAPLIERNSDCVGWLCIPGTEIDYPVMLTQRVLKPLRYPYHDITVTLRPVQTEQPVSYEDEEDMECEEDEDEGFSQQMM